MERTLIILKPSAIQRGLAGEILARFERKGLWIAGMKMMQLTDKLLNEHYAHLKEKPFFGLIKASMEQCPVIVCCLEGADVVQTVHNMAGATNGRMAAPGTIRGDYSMSVQENVIHTSDSVETAKIEIKRFFKPGELMAYEPVVLPSVYSITETEDGRKCNTANEF